ncbi:MAG TPA: hypothetical protein PK557_07175 [Paludibacteraceae bacterium]|nr:hypothetical protein [Paludibacteraceae bacterium]
MARVNIPLTIHRPAVKELVKVTFTANANGNTNVIPFRYPFVDIANYADLKTKGFFRHATTDVSANYGGSKTTGTASSLGYQLPATEKLILLVKVTSALSTDKHIKITVKGSEKYGIADLELKLAEDVTVDTDGIAVAAGDVLEIDLYDFGLLLDANGEITITAAGNASAKADDDKVSFGLIARAG